MLGKDSTLSNIAYPEVTLEKQASYNKNKGGGSSKTSNETMQWKVEFQYKLCNHCDTHRQTQTDRQTGRQAGRYYANLCSGLVIFASDCTKNRISCHNRIIRLCPAHNTVNTYPYR